MMIVAEIISLISNPLILLIPVPYFLVLRVTGDFALAFRWMLFSMAFLLLIGFFMIVAVRRKVFSDLDVSRREQRPLLFVLIGSACFLYFLILYFFRGPAVLYIAVFGIFFGLVLISIINTKIKASIHVATITVLLLTIGILYDVHILLVGVFIPLIAWARIKTKRHTLRETIAGASTGILLTLIMYGVLKFGFHLNF